jgi:hypothetical protein
VYCLFAHFTLPPVSSLRVGRGWLTCDVTVCDRDRYQVTYEDGHREENSSQELSEILFTSNLAMIVIGSRLAVYKEADDKYYEATVTGQRNEKRPFRLEYIHGNHHEWVDLRQYKYRVLPGGTRYHVNLESEAKNADNGGGKLAASMKLQRKWKRTRSEDSSSEEDTPEEENSDKEDSKGDKDLVVAKESITEERGDIMLRT